MNRPDPRSWTKLVSLLPALGLTLLVVLGLVLGPAQGANAADGTGTITYAEPTEDGLQVLVSVPAGAEVDLDGVTVTVDDEKAESTAAKADTDATVQRSTVIAMDTSNSMKGERFAAAQAAAREFINSAPADVLIGIVTFDSDVDTALSPTQDRASALGVVDGLALSKKTRLYEGIAAAVNVVGDAGQRNVLVLSDGADSTTTPIDTVTSAIKEAGVRVDVVALDQKGDALTALQALADAGGGEVIPSDPAALAAAFGDQAAALAAQVLVTVQVPSSVSRTEATLEVTLPTSDGKVTAQAFTKVRSSELTDPTTFTRDTTWSPPSWVLYAGPAAVGLGLILAAVLLVPQPKTVTAADRVSQYTASLNKAGGRRTTARHRRRLRLGEGDGGQHAEPQQGPGRSHQPSPRGGR